MKFLENIGKYINYYNEHDLNKKVLKFGKVIGTKVINWVLILTVLISDKNIPLKVRLMFIASLGYLIMPADLIADFLPVIGFTDDIAFLSYVISSATDYITPEVKEKANSKMRAWLNIEAEDAEIAEDTKIAE